MKRLLFLLFILITSYGAFSQPIDTLTFYEQYLITSNKDSAKHILDVFVNSAETKYKFAGAAVNDKSNIDLIFGYVSDKKEKPVTSQDARLQMFLQRVNKFDRNKYQYVMPLLFKYDVYNLDTDSPVYAFREVYGSFEDLFKVWKSYFNMSADAFVIQKKEYDCFIYKRKNGKYSRFSFSKKGSNGWCIEMILTATEYNCDNLNFGF